MAKFKELRAAEAKARMARKEEPYDALQTRDELATHYTTAGRVCDGVGYHREARKLWERAAVLDPKEVDCRELLVRAYRRDGEPREAIQVLQQLAALVPANPGYPMELGRLHAALKEFEPAEKAFNRVCELAPLDWLGYAALAELYLGAGQKPREAARLAQTAVQLAPSPATYQLLAEARRRSGDLPGARAAIEQAAGPTSPPAPPDESAKPAQEKR
jgi:tetratricopeptide (TPR) repeat protein